MNTARLRVWGEYACFTRPEMKVERVSYDVMTPSAARGILEAVYWKPQIRWVVQRIHVLKPIRFSNIRRNEVGCKIAIKGTSGASQAMRSGRGRLGIFVEDQRQQRAATILRDVDYLIEAQFEILSGDEPPPETLCDVSTTSRERAVFSPALPGLPRVRLPVRLARW